jgi:hypothetical protein
MASVTSSAATTLTVRFRTASNVGASARRFHEARIRQYKHEYYRECLIARFGSEHKLIWV